jgi:hypothetical protein
MTIPRSFAVLFVAAICACGALFPAPTAFAKFVGPPEVGFSCVPGETPLSSNQGCYHQIIQCLPGYSACGGKCVNLAKDVDHCGACAQQCPGGLTGTKNCSAGVCQTGFHPPPPHPYISKPVTLVTGGGWEFKPTRSQATGDLFAINGSGGGLNNAGPGCSNFYSVVKFDRKGPIKSVSPDAGFYKSEPWGDAWATSSGYAGLELFSFFDAPYQNDYDEKAVYIDPSDNFSVITLPFGSTTRCSDIFGYRANPLRTAGIGATTAANLTSPATWDAPVHTWFRPEAEDGQNFYADPGGTGLFGVGSAGAAEHSRMTGHEIATGGLWHSIQGDTYPGGGGAALWIAPNCYKFPNLNAPKNASLIQTNQGFALSPNCKFAKFGGDYLSPHDQALIDQGIFPPGSQDSSSYDYFDITYGDATNGFHGGDRWHHATVDANPCTHNAIVAYYALGSDGSGHIFVKFITPDGKVNSGFTADNLTPVDVATDLSLSRYVARVSLATATDLDANKCYLFTAYDYMDSYVANDLRHDVIYAKLRIWDITFEHDYYTLTTPLKTWDASYDGDWSFHSTVSVSAFSHNLGWFFYYTNAGVTKFKGFVDSNWGLNGLTELGDLSTATMGFDPGGGDYIQAMPGGDRGGFLVPTWSENGAIVARWVAP